MALLSGEVETMANLIHSFDGSFCRSGWLCYPGKLKPCDLPISDLKPVSRFRMALLSGEVETQPPSSHYP